MANNCLYSLSCLNNENYVHYDLKPTLYYGRAITKSLYLRIDQSHSVYGRKQLPLLFSNAQLFVSCFFSLDLLLFPA